MANQMISTNRMSAKALVIKNNSPLQFINNPHTGKTFFMCGETRGYVSPAVAKIKDTCTLDDLQYAECSTDDGASFVPCLMVVGNSANNVQRTLGEDLLY